MEKVRQYTSDRIEICRNCGGTGKDKTIKAIFKSKCPVCEGTGRVKKHTETTITVRSFE